jgi:hypothetical protein
LIYPLRVVIFHTSGTVYLKFPFFLLVNEPLARLSLERKELAASNPDAASQMLQADHGASRISQGTAWSLKRGRTLKAVLAWAALMGL